MLFGLPDCDKVFLTYFDRWYKSEDRERKRFPATRPDVMGGEGLKGFSPEEASPLTADGQVEVKKMVDGMVEAARRVWPSFLCVSEPIDLGWIDAFDQFYVKHRVKDLMKSSKPGDFSNDFVVRCCEFGAMLGHVLLTIQPNLHWVYDWPYWESSVFDPETGQIIAVYHWSIKKFSSYGIDDGYKAKLLACSNLIAKERQGQHGG